MDSLHFFVNILIVIFGIGLIINGRKQEGCPAAILVRIGLFFCSISLSVITYGIDLASRTFFGPRIFPAALEYEAMGYVFASFHIESYFIGMIMFFALSLAALMYPVERNILNRNKNVMSIICLIAAPIPAIIRILELITLPQADTPLFYFYSTLFVLVWLVIFASALTVIYIYLKIAVKSVGEIRRKAIAILVALVLLLVLSFRVSNFLKHITDKPWTFWIVPFLEIMVLILFMYGYSDLTGTDMSDFSLKEFAHNPYFRYLLSGYCFYCYSLIYLFLGKI